MRAFNSVSSVARACVAAGVASLAALRAGTRRLRQLGVWRQKLPEPTLPKVGSHPHDLFFQREAGRAEASRARRHVILSSLVLFALAMATSLRAEVNKEYQLKAAFLYNFTRFVEWPPERFADETSPIVIGIVGENPFGAHLSAVVDGRNINGRKIVIRRVTAEEELGAVHVVFVPAAESAHLAERMAALHRRHVLTVGETGPFTAAGGIITFSLEGDRLRFAVNLNASERAQLKLSSQLLKLATSVRR